VECGHKPFLTITTASYHWLVWPGITTCEIFKQEGCAIAKITVRCALYMSALKVFETPWLAYAYGYFSQIVLMRFCSDRMCKENMKCAAFAVPGIIAIGVYTSLSVLSYILVGPACQPWDGKLNCYCRRAHFSYDSTRLLVQIPCLKNGLLCKQCSISLPVTLTKMLLI